ncbi:MAG: DRTGG domain-containing protein [Candidatus Thorarchaeota archaeon]
MVQNIFIAGHGSTGKTLVALALAARLRAAGKTVSYFKPVGEKSYELSDAEHAVDEDAALMKDYLSMEQSLDAICPVVRTRVSPDEFLRVGHDDLLIRIKEGYDEVSKNVDFVLIEGTANAWDLLHVDLSSPQLAKEFEAMVLCLVDFRDIDAIDDALLFRDFFRQHGIDILHIILNMVPPMLISSANTTIASVLEQFEMDYVGAVVQHKELFSPSIRDILQAVEGTMILGEDKLDVLITDFMVGNMAPENALGWFRRATDKAVITSGDRADVCLAALETDTNLLILTGSLGPDVRTLARARETDTAIMVTDKDTFTTSQLVDDLTGSVHPGDTEKIANVERIIGEVIDQFVQKLLG